MLSRLWLNTAGTVRHTVFRLLSTGLKAEGEGLKQMKLCRLGMACVAIANGPR